MSRRILVVDDVPSNRMLAIAMLKREGWACDEAADGNKALEMLAGDHGYRAVLLDISMPGISGDEVCRRLRADVRTAALPLVAYTAHALEEDRVRILAAGFDAIVIKPVNLATLAAALTQALAKRS